MALPPIDGSFTARVGECHPGCTDPGVSPSLQGKQRYEGIEI
jgi:hypothetical protein